jgi:hypothetical protein
LARKDRGSKRIKEAIDLLEKYLQLCKNEHEMYFLGITRRPPEAKVRDLKRMLRELEDTQVNNTAMMFQIRRLRGRFNTYNTMWTRTIKQIEEGTYHRQRYMADKRAATQKKAHTNNVDVKEQIRSLIRGDAPPEQNEADETATVRDMPTTPSMDLPGRKKPAAAAKPRRGGHSIGSAGLLDEYNSVRASTGGKGRVSADQLQAVLRRHEAAIKKKTGAREVRFRVVDENGKPKIKAIPVK